MAQLLAGNIVSSSWLAPLRNVDGEITIRQLLNHTSGIFNVLEHPDFPWVRPDVDHSKRWGLVEVFDTFVLEPYGPPGTVQVYSSTNYLLVRAIAEQAGGAPVPEQVQRRFLGPLGLASTFMSMGDYSPGQSTMAHPWADTNDDGKLDDLIDTPFNWIATLTHPVLRTTARDLARWMEALFIDRTVLDPRSIEQMLTYPAIAMTEHTGERYGLGVADFTEQLGVPVIGHGGSMLGYSAAALYFPDREAVLVWLLNTGESPADLAQSLIGETWSRLSRVLIANLDP